MNCGGEVDGRTRITKIITGLFNPVLNAIRKGLWQESIAPGTPLPLAFTAATTTEHHMFPAIKN